MAQATSEEQTRTRTAVSWVNKEGRVCINATPEVPPLRCPPTPRTNTASTRGADERALHAIRVPVPEQTWCFCGHRFKVHLKDDGSFRCTARGCLCAKYDLHVAQGAW